MQCQRQRQSSSFSPPITGSRNAKRSDALITSIASGFFETSTLNGEPVESSSIESTKRATHSTDENEAGCRLLACIRAKRPARYFLQVARAWVCCRTQRIKSFRWRSKHPANRLVAPVAPTTAPPFGCIRDQVAPRHVPGIEKQSNRPSGRSSTPGLGKPLYTRALAFPATWECSRNRHCPARFSARTTSTTRRPAPNKLHWQGSRMEH